ncbi:predicted protein [Ostreococcus lucimarinus CCE9901]|jgi:ribosomal protein S18 acetylase RimI-like enzyme|uniref:N-acetyltransferase domain-containing protein n=1 Tax=Ostreococcus lucimarinus (strain CCE9901) TaxID=436017 RepID=A4RTL1_OSTLU|nr:predicted protein [Ostreococcus lucimarinus CCE9901]ABO94344.1 predicted protein [Ostreococcus lucimarinus CCE9901]|eukprot:XP_001416052.1 predicted protein [Ostreococcus lucimarinus CCE9901]
MATRLRAPSRPRVAPARASRRSRVAAPPRAIGVRQVAGEGAALVDRLRACAEVTAESFGADESSAVSVLDGLVRKVRYSGDAFALLEAYDDGASDGEEERLCGCADVTALPAFGPRASKETLVARVPIALGLTEQSNYAYLSGMCVRESHRRRGVGVKLLEACETCARKMTPTPAAMALHVDSDNEGAIALYEGCGYARVIEREVDDAFGRMSRALGGLVGGKKKKILMSKWLSSRE